MQVYKSELNSIYSNVSGNLVTFKNQNWSRKPEGHPFCSIELKGTKRKKGMFYNVKRQILVTLTIKEPNTTATFYLPSLVLASQQQGKVK